MQPPHTEDDTGNAVASRPSYHQYTQTGNLSPSGSASPCFLHQNTKIAELIDPPTTTDLQTLHEIVSLATAFSGKPSFHAVWRAYDAVLGARGVNPAQDSVYFRFILQLQGVEGRNVYDRFLVLLAVRLPPPPI